MNGMVRTRGGVFGPGGHGGGIFDGSESGFGGLGSYYGSESAPLEQAAAGVFRSVQGLGAIYAGVANPIVGQAQRLANAVLGPLNYATLNPDEKLGPATCGAIRYLFSQIPVEELNAAPDAANAFAKYVRNHPELERACTQQVTGAWVTPERLGPPPAPAPTPSPSPPPDDDPTMEFQDPEVLAPPGSCEFEFGDQHGQIEDLQLQLNEALEAEGYETIPVSGAYDARTCGAIFELGGRFSATPSELCPRGWIVPLECEDMVIPKKVGEGGMSTAAMWGLAGLAVAVVGAGVYAATKGA